MDKRTTGIIATVASAVLCGCPGIFLCIFGAIGATGKLPYTTTLNDITNTGMIHPRVGLAMLCFSVVFIAIPIVIGFLTLRTKPSSPNINTPIPPSS